MTSIRHAFCASLIAALALLASPPRAQAASKAEINDNIRATMQQFFGQVRGARELTDRAVGLLVFPTVIKAGFGIGGEYGEGALLENHQPVGYYNLASASFGFQLGATARTVIILFMTPDALHSFDRRDGFKIGVDGSVTVITVGAGGAIDSNNVTKPIVGFVLDPKGLMYNLTLEGSKISRIHPD